MTDSSVFAELWKIAETLIVTISTVWDWLNNKLIINIPIKIPLILENGLRWNTGITPISLLGVGLLGMIVYWFVWGR